MAPISSHRSDVESPSSEKMSVVHNEKGVSPNGLKPEDADFLANFSEASRKRVIRKIDVRMQQTLPPRGLLRIGVDTDTPKLRLIPMLVILYLLAYLDKTNIGTFQAKRLHVVMTDNRRQCRYRRNAPRAQHVRQSVQHRLVHIFHPIRTGW